MDNAIVRVNPKTIYSELEKMRPEIERALPQHIKADRITRIALTQLRMNPDLFNCSSESFFGALLTASQLGLEPGINGQCYLIPYNGVCTLIPGWKGLIDLVARGERASAWTGAVRSGDFFQYQLGSNPRLEHRPGDDDTGEFTHVYAVGWIKGAQWPIIEVHSRAKVKHHLNQYNKVGGKHYALKNENNLEMYGRKIALLQVIKYLPSSVELRDAMSLDLSANEGKQSLTVDMALKNELDGGGVDLSEVAEHAKNTSRIDELFGELGFTDPKITSIKGKHIGNDKGLIEWLEGQVAKKRNDGSKRESKTQEADTAKTGTTETSTSQSTEQKTAQTEPKTTHRESAEPEPQQDAKQSGPAGQEKPKSTPPPAGDFSNW